MTVDESVALPSDPSSASAARKVMASHFTDDALDDARLMVSELVSNAVRHGTGPIRLTVTHRTDSVLVEVFDAGTRIGPLEARSPGGHAEGGRGLAIVSALAAAWSVGPGESGTVAWFEVNTLQR